MRYLSDIGFVVKRINFGEADRFLTIYTKYNGKIEVVAKGVRRINSKRAPHIELLNLIRFHSVKTHKNYILTEVELVNSFEDSKKNLKVVGKMFATCEILNAITPFGERHQDVFELVKTTLNDIQSEKSMMNFQINLLSILGYWNRKQVVQNEEQIGKFIEQIIERKLKAKSSFGV